MRFLKELGRRLTAATSDTRETSFLFQRLSVALQQFTAVCVMARKRIRAKTTPKKPIQGLLLIIIIIFIHYNNENVARAYAI
jgi:hypothetical protein